MKRLTGRNIMVGQSGGPTAVINSSLAGVLSAAAEANFETIYGLINGITGLIDGKLLDLTELSHQPEQLDALKRSPAMYLGSCRYKLPEKNEELYARIFQKFEEFSVGAFFYIGGNDSMDTVAKLSAYGETIGSDVRIIGVPKTIDNDLCGIDHAPGFGSAAKYIATTVREITYDTAIYKQDKVTIVEIMGRDSGWLTASAALAKMEHTPVPQLIYLPEVPFDTEKFLADVKAKLEKNNLVIVCVSEGVKNEHGEYIAASEAQVDMFGHTQLCGVGKVLENLIRDRLGIKVRAVEPNISQRCAGHLVSAVDQEEAFRLGEYAVKLSVQGMTGMMSSLSRVSNNPYQVEFSPVPVSEIANQAKPIPREWINAEGNSVTEEMLDYLAPLILGDAPAPQVNGLPDYPGIGHLIGRR